MRLHHGGARTSQIVRCPCAVLAAGQEEGIVAKSFIQPAVEKPESPGYDVWQAWAISLLQQYADCAARHAKTVQAWLK